MAPLADPTAIPNTNYTKEADAALRHVAHALLAGVESKQLSPHALQVRGIGLLACVWAGACVTCCTSE